MLGPFGVVEQRNTSASSIDISAVLNEITAVLPPARTIFRRRSLMLSSLMAPTRVHPAASAGSVVRRTLVIALSSSSAGFGATEATQADVTEARRAISQKARIFTGQPPTTDRLLFGVDLNPADRPKPPVAIGRTAILLAALDQGRSVLLAPVGPTAIEDDPHAAVPLERVGQGVVALGEVPGHDEQDAARRSLDGAVGPYRDENRHRRQHRPGRSGIQVLGRTVMPDPRPAAGGRARPGRGRGRGPRRRSGPRRSSPGAASPGRGAGPALAEARRRPRERCPRRRYPRPARGAFVPGTCERSR